jgi:hypothetical protein
LSLTGRDRRKADQSFVGGQADVHQNEHAVDGTLNSIRGRTGEPEEADCLSGAILEQRRVRRVVVGPGKLPVVTGLGEERRGFF